MKLILCLCLFGNSYSLPSLATDEKSGFEVVLSANLSSMKMKMSFFVFVSNDFFPRMNFHAQR